MIKRKELWASEMVKAIEARRAQNFVWGSNDCCLFAADVVLAMTGTDLAADFRGRYKDMRGAFVALKKYCGGGVLEVAEKMAEAYGIPRTPVPFAQRGDVVIADLVLPETLKHAEALGIVVGKEAIFVSNKGMNSVPTLVCKAAWRI